ncbi:hypothetical protein C8E03_108144 [Lachnotalea glycerini]|uniref:Uncharacterized protein n=2 Tax=Lachnotalea glycerini TaxID=1763509 RepID=A0A318EK43_9FIRM|nr:hypothetical protein C8E03_108144 [Lachnotalea glycerini]
MNHKNDSILAENILEELPFPGNDPEMLEIRNKPEPDYSLMDCSCNNCQDLIKSYLLIDSLVQDILGLEEEMVRWRQALLRHLPPIDAQNLKSDIYDNLARRYYDNKSYQSYLKRMYNGQDPMESKEHNQMLHRLKEGTDETSVVL